MADLQVLYSGLASVIRSDHSELGRSTELRVDGASEIIIDGVRFSPEALLSLAQSAGQLFVAERQDDVVSIQMVSAFKTPGKPRYVCMGEEAKRLAFGSDGDAPAPITG